MKSRKIIFMFFALTAALYCQDMRQNAYYSLFSDQKANRLGDAITIIVLESTSASNNSQTSATRKSDISLSGSANTGKTSTALDAGLKTGNDFSGQGSTQTTGDIKTKISATVDSVLANGNLVIRGSKKIVINGEEQVVRIKGIVRTSDINPDNSVLSYNISDAEITFDGQGIIQNVQKPGLLTKIFHWLF
jgi:flagellar L-ring protein FlgH